MFRRGPLTCFHLFVRLRQGADLCVRWAYRIMMDKVDINIKYDFRLSVKY